MKISVVIPAYNEENYLPATLDALHKQTRKPDEIVVINGGSTDTTALIAKNNGAKVVTVPHRGIGFARQRGLEESTGDIIAYTDADTIVPIDWLATIEQALNEPSVVGIVGGFIVPDGKFFYRFFINHIQFPLWKFLYLLGLPAGAGQNMAFIKTAAIKAGGFPVNYKMVEDNEMFRRLKTQGKVIFNKDLTVTSSGRRGNEGFLLPFRYIAAFIIYFLFRRGDVIGFKDIR
jgi:glycosyltransferase involved in cell wall biosynthesis